MMPQTRSVTAVVTAGDHYVFALETIQKEVETLCDKNLETQQKT